MSIEGVIITIAAVWVGASIIALAWFMLGNRPSRCACGMHHIEPYEDAVYDMLRNTVHKETACYPREEAL
jgi:predicted DCC family thiol-disulfide oxidoreductase YuxK